MPPAAARRPLHTAPHQLQIIFWSKPIFRTVLMITSCILTTTTATLLAITTQASTFYSIDQCTYPAYIGQYQCYTGNWLPTSIQLSAFLSIYQDSFEHLFLTSVLK